MENSANMTMANVNIDWVEVYREGGVFAFSVTSDAANSNPSQVNISDCVSLFNIYSWMEGGFVYMNNPNAQMWIRSSELNDMSANWRGGVFYIKQGSSLDLEFVEISEVNATQGIMMYATSTTFTFNASRSDFQCDYLYNSTIVTSALDLSAITATDYVL